MKKFIDRLIIFFIIYICVLNTFCINVYGNEEKNKTKYVEIKIYYYDWDVDTRFPLTPDFVRKNNWSKTIIQNQSEIDRLVRWLKIKDMAVNSQTGTYDIRLVIDMIDTKGNRISYYATRFELLSGDYKLRRKIDDNFRNKFNYKK